MGSSLCNRPASAAETLVPAQLGERSDSQGFGWQVMGGAGALGGDSRGCISNAFNLTIGGMQARFNSSMMTADGGTYVFSGWQHSKLDVSRRVRIDLKTSYAQFVDSFKNTSSAPVSVSIALQSRLNNQAQALLTESGPFRGTLGTKDTGVLAVAQPGGIPSPFFHLTTARAKVRPSLNVQNNYQFNISYSITVPAGKTVSLVYGMGQTNLAAIPDAAAVAKLYKPFNDATWLRSVPSELRSTVANAQPSGFGFHEDTNSTDAVAELGERGPHDMLLVGDLTRLRGTLLSGDVSIETKRGKKQLPLERIAGVFGGNQRGRTPKLVLRDGQVLVGLVEMPELKFTLNSGLDVSCDLANVDRFVFREAPDDGKPVPEVFAYVDLLEGDRLAVKRGDTQKIVALTTWGVAEIALEEIDVWTSANPSQGTVTHRLVLRDGSEFSTMISDGNLQFVGTEYGNQTWSVFDIRRMRAAHRGKSTADHTDPAAPHAVLIGENRFVGQVDLRLLNMNVQGQTVPIAPAQLKSLKREEKSIDAVGDPNAVFVAEFWDGDAAVGTLQEQVLPLRTVGGVLQVPVVDLVELRNPAPTVPESLRGRINELLADLGHIEWARREAATKELRSLGAVVKEQGEDALKATTDPEVRKRLQTLLDAIKE